MKPDLDYPWQGAFREIAVSIAERAPTEQRFDELWAHLGAVDHKVNMNRGNTPSALIRRTGMCAKGRHPLGAPGHGCRECSRESRSAQRKAPACPVYNGGRGMGSLALRAMLEKKA